LSKEDFSFLLAAHPFTALAALLRCMGLGKKRTSCR